MRFEPAADSLHHKVKEPLETKEKQKSPKENVENEVRQNSTRLVEQLIEDEEDFVLVPTKVVEKPAT